MTLSYQLDRAASNLKIERLNRDLAEAELALAYIALGRENENWSPSYVGRGVADIIRFISRVNEQYQAIIDQWEARHPNSYHYLAPLRISVNKHKLTKQAMAAELRA